MGIEKRFLAERTAKVAALARAKQWQKAVFLALVETPVHLQDLRLRNAALAALGRGIRWAEALALLPSKPMASSINAVLGACDKAKCWSKALQLWKATSPDLITYNTAIAACFGAPPHVASDNALSIFQHLCSHAAEPDVVSWNSLVKACSRSSWRAAWVAFSMSKAVTAQALTSCTATAPWKWALDRLTWLEVHWRLQPDLVLYNTIIGTCSSASDWQPALELLCKEDSENVSPDIISYNSVITSCGRGRCLHVLTFLPELRCQRLTPNRVTFNSLLSACDGAGDWQKSIELLMDLIYSTLEPVSS